MPLMPTPLKVATPATAFTVTVPTVVAPVFTDIVTAAVLPVTVLPTASRTVTTGWVVKAAPLAATAAEVVSANCVAAPGVPVAVKVKGEPLKLPLVAVSVLAPAVVLRVQAGLVAMPALSLVTVAGEPGEASEPPPLAAVKVTDTPLTALPCASVTFTDGAVVTAVPTVALCELPPFNAIVAAVPEVTANVVEVADVRDPLLALSV